MSWKGKSADRIISEGCDWLLGDVSVLANRHHYAEVHDLKEWPPEWDYWAHYGEGVKQYHEEKRQHEKGKL